MKSMVVWVVMPIFFGGTYFPVFRVKEEARQETSRIRGKLS
jgi:hypothetical protein